MAADPNDPFASMGGGVLVNGGWVPKGHPLAQQQQQAAPELAPPTAAPAPNTADPFASIGGGIQTANGGWVPKGMAGTPAAPGTVAPPAPGAAPPATDGGNSYLPTNAAPGTPGATNLATQNANAQTYSLTPGAAPVNNTTNAATQDVVRNSYLDTLSRGTNVDTNDPTFRMQADAFGAAQERARRNAIDDSAQANFAEGTRGSGAENIERRMADEASARNQGTFEAGLVGQELQSRRSEIQNALASLGGMIDNDQKMALTRELANLDAAIKREGLTQTGQLGNRDIDVREQLGLGGLNVNLISALLGNQNFNDQLGFNVSNSAVQNLLRAMGR